MKLKRLLPIASIAGVATVVTPLVTSCNSGKTFVYTFDSRNPAYQFTPENQIKREEQKLVYAKDATEDYLTTVKKNKQIFAEDLIYSTIQSYTYSNELLYGKATVKIDKIEPKTGMCSFLFTADIGASSSKEQETPSRNVSIGFAVKNVEYVMYYDSGIWYFVPYIAYILQAARTNASAAIATVIAYLRSYEGWSFTLDVSASIHDQDRGFSIVLSNDVDDDVLTTFLGSGVFNEGIQSFMFANMYYWQNVGCRDVK